MGRKLQIPRVIALLGLCLGARSAFAVTSWTFSIPEASTGSFTASESTNSVSVQGTYSRLSNGFIKMTVTASSGSNAPTVNTVKFGIEVPGFAFFSQPILTNERRIISSVSTGVCPTTTFNGIMAYSLWSGTAGTTTDVSQTTTPAFGTVSWNPGTNIMTVTDLRNLANYGSLGVTPFTLSGTCSSGIITFTGAGDRGGTLYVTDTNGGIYVTNTERAILILPQVAIPSVTQLSATYAAFNYNEANLTDMWPLRMTISTSGTTSGTGDALADI